MDAGALLIAGVVLAPALAATGSGWLNGDAAAYGVGAWDDRWTHAAYVLLLRGIDGDLLSWIASLGVAWGAARRAAVEGGDPRIAAAGAAAVMLPWAAFAEVDPCWIAAIAVGGWAAAAGVAFSPVAVLALPWAGRAAVVAGLAAVVASTIVSGGAWWTGERGVLTGPPVLPGRTAGEWALHLPWALLPAALADRRWLLLAPLLLAPPDVPAWLLVGVAWAVAAARVREGWVIALVAGQVAIGGFELWRRTERVRAEEALVRSVAAAIGPEDGLVAPWTWGARVAVASSGDPYGIRWHPPGRWLRDQEAAWRAAPPARVWLVGVGRDACPADATCVLVEIQASASSAGGGAKWR